MTGIGQSGWCWQLLAQMEPAQAAVQPAQEAAGPVAGWVAGLFLLGILVVPFILGTLIAEAVKLRDLGGKIGVVLLSIALACSPFLWRVVRGEPWASAIRLGIDLAGGANLVYQIDVEQARRDGKLGENERTVNRDTVDKMVKAVGKRIDPGSTEEITVRRVGDDRIEVIIPGADQDRVREIKERITKLGSLEFAILATPRKDSQWIREAEKLTTEQNDYRVEGKGRVVSSWRDVVQTEKLRGPEFATRVVKRTNDKTKKVEEVTQLLVIHEPPEKTVTGNYLTRASIGTDNKSPNPVVNFTFNSTGRNLFAQLTIKYAPDEGGQMRHLAILLDGKIQSAPVIREPITQGSGQISGTFTRKEVEQLVSVLNAGALDVPLKPTPVSEFTISPLLGIDVQQKGVTSIIVATVVVFGFMLIYYRTAGVVADLSLVLNLLLVIGSMAFIGAPFSLPGLAGLVLTIGMAVDSNVLIYERMREELQRGASLRMAIENGFDKAFAAIFDSNITTLITAWILYAIGSDQIRGFAVSLFIGLSMSMFSALYFGRLLFSIIERKRIVKTLTMMESIGVTKIDFLSTAKVAFAASATLILAGLFALYTRGQANMDIDFTGGTMVTFEFEQPQKVADISERINKQFTGPLSLEQLTLGNEKQDAAGGRRFRVRTTETRRDKVQDGINQAFAEEAFKLKRISLTPGEVQPITPASFDDLPAAVRVNFEGGHQAQLKFSSPIRNSSVLEQLGTLLRKHTDATSKAPKYEQPERLLFAINDEATKDSNADRYSGMTLTAAKAIDATDLGQTLKDLQTQFEREPLFEELTSFDTSVADGTKRDAILALIASLVMIVIYMWFRFEKVYFGVAAVIALAHDVLVTLGSVALGAYVSGTPLGPILLLDDFKVNMGLIASLLTIVGYSLNDTIVIFDRIREIKGKNPNINYEMINLSVNQTLSRTLLTALTVLLVVLVMYIFGGDGIHGFAFSMLVGTITGCYSTVYIANPALLWLVTRKPTTAAKVTAS